MTTEEKIAAILAQAIDARVPYAKIVIYEIAKLVTDEREACASIADALADSPSDHEAGAALMIASAIRARSLVI